ncbi:MAG: branched-chain amino acid ABC transporter permease [Nitrospiraceae bacterium]|nr:branched-chain amino acid ABC transporter permease [Nitrospiraceae bacterium]
MKKFRTDLFSCSGFLILLLVLPKFLTNDYYTNTLTLSWIHAIIAVGLNLLIGYAGQISLGHAAFYGIAAYTTAILTTTFSLPIIAGMLAGIIVVAIVAYLIGIPTLKLKGHYLAMGTLGFGIIVYIFFNETISITGGPSGFTGIPRLNIFGFKFDSDLSYYYVVTVVLTLIIFVSLNIINSRIGRALRAIHTSESAAQIAGIDISKYKLFVFVLSAIFAAIAGVLYAHYLSFVAPSSFGFNFSIELLAMVVLGGMANIWGAVAGALFLTVLPEFLRTFENIEILLYGAILIVCMIFLPGGIAGGIFKIMKIFKREKAVDAEKQ